jgi:hypothetical protein
MPQLFSNRKKINVTPINYSDCQREREREREMQPKKQRPKLNAKLDTDTDVKKHL